MMKAWQPGLTGPDRHAAQTGKNAVRLGDGTVPPGKEREARLAESNCPERAIEVLEET